MSRFLLLALLLVLARPGAAAQAGMEAPPADQSAYSLFPGDLVHVEVFGQPDLTCTLRVATSGVLAFPLVGEVPGITGMTVAGLTGELKRRYEDGYLKEALVIAVVQEFGPRSAYIMGSVRTPGAVALSPFAKTTAMQAIVRAGGFLPEGNRAGTLVVRNDPKQPGAKVSLTVPVADSAEQLMWDVVLEPDDLVIVPQLDRVSVIGNVRTPGAITLPATVPLTVTKAIALVGGFDRFARSDSVQLIRVGAPTVVVDVDAVLNSGRGVDPVLKPGDTVYIPESRF